VRQSGGLAESAEAARPGHSALAGAGHSALSGPEVELLRLLGQGLPCDAVARRLHTSERTVRRRTKAICDRLEVTASIEAVVWAAHRGLI
jgi:DNA-binding NarL/FixJ family response regulator